MFSLSSTSVNIPLMKGVLIKTVANKWLNETTEVAKDIKHLHAKHQWLNGDVVHL